MSRPATLEKAIEFTRISVTLTFCWPASPTATTCELLRMKILRTALTLNGILVLLPQVYAVYVYREDAVELSKACVFILAALQPIIQSFFCSTEYNRIQRLIEEMKLCAKTARSHEEVIFQRYVDKYSPFYKISTVWFYATTVVVVMGSLLTEQRFPVNAKYPFAIDYQPVTTIIFLSQSFMGLYCASHICMNEFVALLLFFAAARFEILAEELRDVTAINDLIKCVNKYYEVRRYAQEAVEAVRHIALITVLMAGGDFVFCGLNCIGTQPFTVKMQFMSIAATALLEVFMCAWPGDQLMETSENSNKGVYESKWYDQTVGMQKDVLYILLPQEPVVIRIPCFIPTLSLNYYCSFISNVFSFFTALRVTMNEDD